MSNMKRQHIAGLTGRIMMAAVSVYMAACADDRLMERHGGAATEATPVRFETYCAPLYSVTRSAPALKEWREGDKIQILATFKGEGMAESGKEPQYGCYRYSGEGIDGEWEPDEESDRIFWPVGSESATFEAYYIKTAEGRISDGHWAEQPLGSIGPGEDPLHAKTDTEYGHSVSLTFGHLCAHLTLKDVKADYSEGYWLYRKTEGEEEIPNACRLSYAKGKGLEFGFISLTPEGGNGHSYIERQRDNAEGSVDFYLAQETTEDGGLKYAYGNCELAYRFNRPYLSFNGVESLDSLKAGSHYELSIEKELGIVPQPETDFPEEPDPDPAEVDIPDLLDGIVHSHDVKDKNDNVVLKTEGEPWPRLMRDVDFKKFNPMDYIEGKGEYTDNPHPDWRLPEFSGTFDGNFHSFLHVAYPVFGRIGNGKIYNLAIRDSECDISVEDITRMETDRILSSGNEGSMDPMTDFGLLACTVNGYLYNLLFEDVSMTVHLDDTLAGNIGSRAYRIGCLTGNQDASSAAGTGIGKVRLRGEVKLTVTTDTGKLNQVQSCYIGILAGEAGSLIDGVTSAGKCTVSVPVKGSSSVWAGGLAGKISGEMRNVTLDTDVDCGKLHVMQTYVGGLCGEAAGMSEGGCMMEDCNAIVSVKGGTVEPVNTSTYAHSYAGGIAARISSVKCDGISVTGSVTGGAEEQAVTNYPQMINYATGGGFGYVTGKAELITRCRAETTVTAAALQTTGQENNSTGSFAGRCDSGIKPEDLETDNSAQDNNGMPFVGMNKTEPGNGN